MTGYAVYTASVDYYFIFFYLRVVFEEALSAAEIKGGSC